MAVRPWVWVTLAVVGVCLLAFIALVGFGVYFVVRQIDVESATPASAAERFEQARARFQGQKPLIEFPEDDWSRRPQINRREQAAPARPDSLHVLAWDPDEDKIVSLSLPFWLLRLSKRGTMNFSLGEEPFELEKLNLTVEELEQHGPGLILDQEGPGGERVLIWTQ